MWVDNVVPWGQMAEQLVKGLKPKLARLEGHGLSMTAHEVYFYGQNFGRRVKFYSEDGGAAEEPQPVRGVSEKHLPDQDGSYSMYNVVQGVDGGTAAGMR